MRALLERLLHLPPAPLPPPGDETSAQVFRAAPAYFTYRLVVWLIGTVFILGVEIIPLIVVNVAVLAEVHRGRAADAAAALMVTLAALILVATVVARLLALVVLRLDFERRWYLVTDRSLRIREGIWVVREMTITFANIQNLAVSQGPLQRALGLFDLRVETAGGGGAAQPGKAQAGLNLHSACFRGIANATEVKELIQQRLRALKDSGLGDHEEHRTAPSSTDLLDALRAVLAEARALREAV